MTADAEPGFMIHEHFAKHHHFDLRLEHDGVLKSWAVPKGLPEKSGDRRHAIAAEDNATEYISFTGTIPEGAYGAREVKIRDAGTFIPLVRDRDRIEIVFHGRVITGKFTSSVSGKVVRMPGSS